MEVSFGLWKPALTLKSSFPTAGGASGGARGGPGGGVGGGAGGRVGGGGDRRLRCVVAASALLLG